MGGRPLFICVSFYFDRRVHLAGLGLRDGGRVSAANLFSSLFYVVGVADGGCQDNGGDSQTKTSFVYAYACMYAYFLRGVEVR